MANFFKKLIDGGRRENTADYTEDTENTENAEDTEVVSRERAKADLEKRIAEKLSRMSETDLEELFMLHEQQLKTKKMLERNSVGRRSIIEGQISFVEVNEEPGEAEDEDVRYDSSPEFIDFEDDEDYEEDESREANIGPDKEQKTFARKFSEYFDKFASGTALEACDREIRAFFSRLISSKAAFAAARLLAAVTAKIALAVKKVTSKIPPLPHVLRERPGREQKKTRAVRYTLLNYKRRFKRGEKKASSGMAGFISRMDSGNDKLAEKTTEIVTKGRRGYNFAREWSESNKKRLLTVLVALIAVAITTISVINANTAYVYAYNGRPLGMVKNQEDVLRVLDVVSEQLTREYGAEVEIDKDKDITFERVFAQHHEVDDMQEVFNRLTYMQDMNVRAYALNIDGKRIAILDTKENAEKLLNDFRDIYLHEPQNMDVTYENVSFAEKVDIVPIDTQLGKIQNPDDVIDKMLTGAVAQKIHVVEKGQTFSGIAKMYGITQAELESTNPGINPAKLSIGQEIVLAQAVPLLTVQTVEVATYSDIIPYDTNYEDSAGLYKGEQSTKVKGVNGEREVTARIIRDNGIEVDRVELSSVVIKEASPAVVLRGTKDLPPLQGTGKLKAPVSGYRITSKFGMRGGSMHTGVDMACKYGTDIHAADGGTVTFAGYKGSYGYLIIINHGGGMETYYAHCSTMLVKKGDKVYQGQHIANVGTTGRSTGPHVHFEVRINGTPKNPLNYL